MQQRPEFLGVVLQRGSSHQNTMLVPVLLEAGLRDDLEAFVQLAPPVAQPVGFVDNDAAPGDFGDFLGWKEGGREGGRVGLRHSWSL